MPRKGRCDREIVDYLRVLENSIVDVLKTYGIVSQGKSLQKNPILSSEADETGVWVGSQKIASLGVGVRKWITFHGAAINLNFDSTAFTGMNPCGFTTNTMVSLEPLLNEPVDREEFASRMKSQLLKNLQNLL
jgi:lipoyl(octanoyl) transferase